MLIHAALASERRLQRLIFSLTLAPLIRLVSLSLPLVNFPFAYWYMIVGAPLLLAAIVAARVVGVNRKMAGVILGRHWFLQILIGLSGLGLGYLEYKILRPEPLIPEFNWIQMLAPAFVLLVFTGFLEEYIFRGVMQYTAQRSLGVFGMVYISALFAALHIGYKSILDLAFVFVVAISFSLAAQKTRSLLGVTLAHGLTNIGLFLIFPFIVAAPRPVVPQPISGPPAIEQPANLQQTPSQKETFCRPPLPPDRSAGQPCGGRRPPIPLPQPGPHARRKRPFQAQRPRCPQLRRLPRTPSMCAPPTNWVAYTVQPGESLALFRQIFHLRKSELLAANCNPALEEVVLGTNLLFTPFAAHPGSSHQTRSAEHRPAQPPGERPPPEPPSSRP